MYFGGGEKIAIETCKFVICCTHDVMCYIMRVNDDVTVKGSDHRIMKEIVTGQVSPSGQVSRTYLATVTSQVSPPCHVSLTVSTLK